MDFLTTIGAWVVAIVALYIVASFGISTLPVAQALPSGFTDAITQLFSYIRGFNFFFPVDTLMVIVGLSLQFYLAMYIARGVFWVIHLLRGIRH